MTQNHYPSLYQINTRVRLTSLSEALSATLGRPAQLDDILDADSTGWRPWASTGSGSSASGRRVRPRRPSRCQPRLASRVRRNAAGPQGRRHRRLRLRHPELRRGSRSGRRCRAGSPAAAAATTRPEVDARLRPQPHGPDHPWVEEHPDYFVAGTEELLARSRKTNPHRTGGGGPDSGLRPGSLFAGWPDTLQIDYCNPAAYEAMIRELERIAGQCDGVRCDMAMLLLPEVFERTWGRRPEPFWPAAIPRVRSSIRTSA